MSKYPIDLVVRRLTRSEWPMLEKAWADEYGADLPFPEHSDWFYGAFLGDEMVGFAHFERLIHFNAVYVAPEHRNKHIVEGIFDGIDGDRDAGESVVILPRSEVEKTLGRYGFRKLAGESVWRKDY